MKKKHYACSVEGCDRKHLARGMCNAHYRRVRRTGDVRADVPVGGHGTCTVEGCGRTHYARGRCNAHYLREYRDGDVRADRPIRPYGSDEFAYVTVHRRLATQRGRAAEHTCIDCGNAAEHWSYDHTDPDERDDDRGYPYSADLDHYDPRCQPCHEDFDRERVSA